MSFIINAFAMNNSKLTHRFTHLNFDGILVVFYAKNTRDFSIVII